MRDASSFRGDDSPSRSQYSPQLVILYLVPRISYHDQIDQVIVIRQCCARPMPSRHSSVQALGHQQTTRRLDLSRRPVQALDNATVDAYGNATVKAGDNATVNAGGSATVKAGQKTTVIRWSAKAAVTLEDEAVLVDRSGYKPVCRIAEEVAHAES